MNSGIGQIDVDSDGKLTNPAHKGVMSMYLDPGSGSIILQILLGVLLSVAVFFRLFWGKIKNLFGKGNSEAAADTEEDNIRG